ncbi:carbamoyltransferase N-terminal domain-containing protein [Actinoplanes derwentensis]|uniref:carbamoyltransferase N-terminal domain-containing protein n=1 Tax=Actinoplanes derwentensis TaxID=113562 RepID=UPI0018D28B6C|nr:carbamoyltransferase N-terminal domain-containing protein [Actinoplanes derwentensis]
MKVTHDGGVAVVEDGRLRTSVEVEKLGNRARYTDLLDTDLIAVVLKSIGLHPSDIDTFVVDGWGFGGPTEVNTMAAGEPLELRVAAYREAQLADDSLRHEVFDGLRIGGREHRYHSYHHTTGHVMSAYATSPFAARREPAFVVVWDGGTLPRGYVASPDGAIENLGPIFGLIGNLYATFSMRFPPFRPEDIGVSDERLPYMQLSVPGKVMAYVAKGQPRPELCQVLDDIYRDELDVSLGFAEVFAESFLKRAEHLAVRPEDALASMQHWLGEQLVDSVRTMRSFRPGLPGNLCLAGGCALNIKWNTRIRTSAGFDEVYVPPFPNDSGSAFGAACAEHARISGSAAVQWSVFAGPRLTDEDRRTYGYRRRECDIENLARILHETGEPVVVLHGAAELGPRALGHRSIIAPATDPAAKDILNEIKVRESYRPVSPICIEDRAPEIFDPGTPDPFMLFDHTVRPGWRDRIPAVVHLDGSARLQTVDPQMDPTVGALLTAYDRLSGVPVLCNTSANLNGSGFFPDVASALRWGRTRLVWSEGWLYEKEPGRGDERSTEMNAI